MPSPAPEKNRVLVIGSFVQDLTWDCAEFPRAGETVIGRFRTGPGGKGSNQAVAAARAGARVTFVGGLGKDTFGDGAREFLRAEGIDCRAVEKSGVATGTAGILVNAHGQNEIVVALGASAALQPADLDAQMDIFKSAAVVLVQHEATLEVNAHALRRARAAGALTMLNPAPMRADFDPAILSSVDLLVPNETEFAALVNRLPDAAAKIGGEPFNETALAALDTAALQALCRCCGVPTVIITLGARGCFVSTSAGGELVPAVTDVRVVDTTGAGDAFAGALAAGLAEFGRGEVARAARFANVAAALSVTRVGTAPAMPRRAEIDALFSA